VSYFAYLRQLGSLIRLSFGRILTAVRWGGAPNAMQPLAHRKFGCRSDQMPRTIVFELLARWPGVSHLVPSPQHASFVLSVFVLRSVLAERGSSG